MTIPTFDVHPASMLATAPPVAGVPNGGGAPAPATTGADGAPLPAAAPAPGPSLGPFMLMMFGLLALMIVMQVFAGRKEKKKRAEMLGSLRRHDKVLTVGGVIGTVAEVRDDEIVLKVDESTNTKMRFSKASVQQVVKHAAADEPAVEKSVS